MADSARAGPLFGGLILMAFGAILLIVALRGKRTGALPAGANFLRPLIVRREGNGAAFRLLLLLYGAAGLTLEVWGILSLIGMAAPPKIA